MTGAARCAGVTSIFQFPVLHESHDISRTVAAIRDRKVTVGVDGHLRLPRGFKWPAATNNVLFVRKCYGPLLEHVLKFCQRRQPEEHETADRRVVTGTPGIGKSTWM